MQVNDGAPPNHSYHHSYHGNRQAEKVSNWYVNL